MCSHWDELRVEQNRPVSQLPLRECCGGTHVARSLCDRSLLAGLANPARTLGGAFHAGWVSRSGTNQAIKGQTAQYPPAQSCAPGIGPGLSYTPT